MEPKLRPDHWLGEVALRGEWEEQRGPRERGVRHPRRVDPRRGGREGCAVHHHQPHRHRMCSSTVAPSSLWTWYGSWSVNKAIGFSPTVPRQVLGKSNPLFRGLSSPKTRSLDLADTIPVPGPVRYPYTGTGVGNVQITLFQKQQRNCCGTKSTGGIDDFHLMASYSMAIQQRKQNESESMHVLSGSEICALGF